MTQPLSVFYKTTRVPITLSHISHSQDQDFRSCSLKWYRHSVLKLEANVKKPALLRGLAFHEAFSRVYCLEPADRKLELLINGYEQYLTNNGNYPEAKPYQTDIAVGHSVLKAYWEKYGQDAAIPRAQTEWTGNVKIPHTEVMFTFRVDLLVLGASPFILDFKTGERVDVETLITHDLQLPRYLWALSECGHTDVTSAVYQVIKTPRYASGVTEFDRRVIKPSRREVAWAIHDLAMIVKEVQREDRLIYPVYSQMCANTCDYHQLCLVSKMGGDPQPLIEELFHSGRKENQDKDGGSNRAEAENT